MTTDTLKTTFKQTEDHRKAARERLRRAETGGTGEAIEQGARFILNFEDSHDPPTAGTHTRHQRDPDRERATSIGTPSLARRETDSSSVASDRSSSRTRVTVCGGSEASVSTSLSVTIWSQSIRIGHYESGFGPRLSSTTARS